MKNKFNLVASDIILEYKKELERKVKEHTGLDIRYHVSHQQSNLFNKEQYKEFCRYFDINNTRQARSVNYRKALIYYLFDTEKVTTKNELARIVNLDHSTIISHLKSMNDLLEVNDEQAKDVYEKVKKYCQDFIYY